jgi:hypothetical protein
LHRSLKVIIWLAKSTPAVGFPHGAPPQWRVSRVVHSLFKEYIMRKIILAAAVAGAALTLSACGKTEAPATSAESVDTVVDTAVSADSAASVDATSAASSN